MLLLRLSRSKMQHFRRDYQRCLHLDPFFLPARVNLAYTLQMVGFYRQAWNQFTAAINIDKGESINLIIFMGFIL